MKPAISIIVPVYNVESYLKQCLESLLAQTFTDIEIILINDGSMDKSGDICDEYAKHNSRIKVVHKEYGGVSSSRNVGIKLAQGDYLGFVDSDDRIDVNMYKELYELCVQSKSDISICMLGREINGELLNRNEEEIIKKEMNNTEAMRELFKGVLYRFSLCNKLFRKSCFIDITFPEGRIHEDLSTTYKLFAKCNRAIFTNYIGYIYIKRENSILTKKFSDKRLDAFIGWGEILPFMNEKYPQLSREFLSCFVYGCVDNVNYILNQVENKKDQEKYLSSIQLLVRKYFRGILTNNALSIKYKYLITLLNCNIGFLIETKKIKAYIKRIEVLK
ncbi:glycosyltransferase family 2 protein [Paenibacillus sp. 2RAB27]|uniref:glycosyltransferase family 2 protein n=1 Tax=Paenibacillus sp. 2RAB27 TaxID=3232991 RepID=UPI003F9BEC2F